jgi:8-oxo-dGTP pyrophosphatase MutT (NUDIX family)
MPHIHEKYDFTVTFFIVFDNRVLLVNHPRYGKWIPPGGHIELDEDPEEALFREIEEETGLEVEILSSRLSLKSPGTKFLLTPNFVDVHEANPPHKHISFIYFAVAKSDKSVLSSEHDDMHWVPQSKLSAVEYKLDGAVQFYANQAIELASKA